MKSKKSLSKKLLLGFSITGGILTIGGLPMFIAGGVGTYSISKNLEPNQSILKSTGYFNQESNFQQLVTFAGSEFDEEKAKSLELNYNIFGFITWYRENWENNRPNPTMPPLLYKQFKTKEDFNNYLDHIKIDNTIFITGAVLWPIGLTILIITGSIGLAFKLKNKNR